MPIGPSALLYAPGSHKGAPRGVSVSGCLLCAAENDRENPHIRESPQSPFLLFEHHYVVSMKIQPISYFQLSSVLVLVTESLVFLGIFESFRLSSGRDIGVANLTHGERRSTFFVILSTIVFV